ncbi:hypothetical protein KAW43_00760 [Candidatus Parcubacteria bacterium]|jgi:hypothetical protein|nr:hypothetical protein [Candidatus Parcubacteria bacterium]
MRERKLEKLNTEIEKEPIVDIEVDKEELEKWKALESDLEDLTEGAEDLLIEQDDKFVFHPANFELTSDYSDIEDQEELSAEEKLRKKVILNYAFEEFGFDIKNPEIIEEKIIQEGEETKTIKYFRTNQPNLILGFDGVDWWIEKKDTIQH